MICCLLDRVIHSPHEQDRTGFIVTDQEQKRLVGLEYGLVQHSFHAHDDGGRRRRFATLFVHFDDRFVNHFGDIQVCGYAGLQS